MYKSLPGELMDKGDIYSAQQIWFKRQWDILTEFYNILRAAADRENQRDCLEESLLWLHIPFPSVPKHDTGPILLPNPMSIPNFQFLMLHSYRPK